MYESKVFVVMVLILIFAEVLGLYGCAVSPLFLPAFPLITPPQIDRGVDHEHKGDGIEVLIVRFNTCNPRLPLAFYRL